MSSQERGSDAQQEPSRSGGVAREVAAGLFLIALAALAWAGAFKLNFGQLSGIGPGLMPKVTATIVAAFGALLVLQGVTVVRERMEAWSLRGMLYVLGSVLAFAATIRGFDLFDIKMPSLGLSVAGPLAVMISAFADRDTRWIEVITFAVVITALCIGLFKFLLRLPIPIAPWLLGY